MYYDVNFKEGVPLSSKNFQKILSFYLFRCPVEGRSVRSTTFAQQGWTDTMFSTLKRHMLYYATDGLKKRYHPCKREELDKRFEEMENTDETEEFCVFLKHDEKKVMESLYVSIRNALAHGSFTVKTHKGIKVYFFANYDGYLKAQIQLREDTLLNWIRIFNSNPVELKGQK